MDNEKNASKYSYIRSAYYSGKLLRASDFTTDQEYGNSKLEYINRKFHGWGIVEGLQVQTTPEGDLRLLHGSAIDPRGRILEALVDRQVEVGEIEGLGPQTSREFILGMHYTERIIETELAVLEEEKISRPVRIAETYALRAYEEAQLRELKAGMTVMEEALTEEKLLYDSGSVTLTLRVPRVVPRDSFFRVCIQARAVQDAEVRIGWRGMAKLQGAVFAQTGEPVMALEEEQAMCSGSLQREWDICTEENRKLPVLLELAHLEVITEQAEAVELPTCQFCIETAAAFEQAVKKYLRERSQWQPQEDWVPLARLKLSEGSRPGQYAFTMLKENGVRCGVTRPGEEETLRKIAEENGILDVRWRSLMSYMRSPQPPFPSPPPAQSSPGPLTLPDPQAVERQLRELLSEERENRIHRGVAVIPLPRRCRRGSVILSDRILHGFPGEEVLLWCGRVLEEQYYVYWKRGGRQYRILSGAEGMFPEERDCRHVRQYAFLQDVEEGSFQIALRLDRKNRRSRSREVAVSWTAVRIG
ncbi:MAG: hypothetical protein NC543_10160 [bacterium]|nr:hypothetical protein [bacterium]MCM1374320.1 hypothetical protein [Muribaculum sp.]